MQRKYLALALAFGVPASAFSQVPDLLNALDAGAGAMGSGGALYATGGGTISAHYNPAGLAFTNKTELGLAFRNLPLSNSAATGDSANRNISTSGTPGKRSLTHFGYAAPLSSLGKKGSGVVALTYTVGGYVDDNQTSQTLKFGTLTAKNYKLLTKAQADYYTLSFAKYDTSKNMSIGIGLNYVRQKLSVSESGVLVDGSNQAVTNLSTNNSENPYGYGVTLGIQGSARQDLSWGLSYQTPVSLKGNADTSTLYSKIPGRLLGGIALRRDGIRGSQDYLVYGLESAYYHGGKGSGVFDRTNQVVTNLGLEYNAFRYGGRIPIRVGYQAVNKGGDGFANRNTLTYGVGYRPENGKYGVDLSFASPQNGGFDVAIGLTYRFDK